jgi:hypothetical protein
MLDMNISSVRMLLSIALLAGTWVMAEDQPGPSVTPNQVSANLEKGLPPIPVITGGVAFNTSFEPNQAEMNPVVAPIILVPLGRRALIESEFEAQSDIVHTNGSFEPVTLEKGVEYAQLDFFASKYLTVVAGRFATPFNVYKERFDARWIRNLVAAPLIFGVSDNSSNGGMLRGAIPINSRAQVSYSGYFSAQCNNAFAGSDRQSGFRTALFFPGPRLEAGFSLNRRMGAERFNNFGTDFSWNVRRVPLDIRSEALFSKTAGNGYWIEGAYRLSSTQFPKWLRRSQAVLRGEQYFTSHSPVALDLAMPEIDTNRVFTGWNYWLTDSVRAGVAYGRQFAQDDNHNIWTIGISYRFVR